MIRQQKGDLILASRRTIFLLVAVVGALAIGGGVYAAVSPPQYEYIAASQAITAGTKLGENNLTNLGSNTPLPNAIPVPQAGAVVGQTAQIAIPAGDLVYTSDLGSGSYIDKFIDATHSAYTIPADNISAVTPDLTSGDYVEVTVAGASKAGNGGNLSYVLSAHPWQVIGTEQNSSGGSSNSSGTSSGTIGAVILQVPNSDVSILNYARQFGTLQLALVNKNAVFSTKSISQFMAVSK